MKRQKSKIILAQTNKYKTLILKNNKSKKIKQIKSKISNLFNIENSLRIDFNNFRYLNGPKLIPYKIFIQYVIQQVSKKQLNTEIVQELLNTLYFASITKDTRQWQHLIEIIIKKDKNQRNLWQQNFQNCKVWKLSKLENQQKIMIFNNKINREFFIQFINRSKQKQLKLLKNFEQNLLVNNKKYEYQDEVLQLALKPNYTCNNTCQKLLINIQTQISSQIDLKNQIKIENQIIQNYFLNLKKEQILKQNKEYIKFRKGFILKDQQINQVKVNYKCDACNQPFQDFEKDFLQCQQCKINVHPSCYQTKLSNEQNYNWLCDFCNYNKKSQIKQTPNCPFCPVKTGAFKRTQFLKTLENQAKINKNLSLYREPIETLDSITEIQNDQQEYIWVHLSCTFWIDKVYYQNKTLKQYSNLKQSRFNKICQICNNQQGYTIKCQSDCQYNVHVECARQNNQEMNIINWTDSGIKFHCLLHQEQQVWNQYQFIKQEKVENLQKFLKIVLKYFNTQFTNIDMEEKQHQLEAAISKSIDFEYNAFLLHTNPNDNQEYIPSKKVQKIKKQKKKEKFNLNEVQVLGYLNAKDQQFHQLVIETYRDLEKLNKEEIIALSCISDNIIKKIAIQLSLKQDKTQEKLIFQILNLRQQIEYLLKKQNQIFFRNGKRTKLKICEKCKRIIALNINKRKEIYFMNNKCYICSLLYIKNRKQYYEQQYIYDYQEDLILKIKTIPDLNKQVKKVMNNFLKGTQKIEQSDIIFEQSDVIFEQSQSPQKKESQLEDKIIKEIEKDALREDFTGIQNFFIFQKNSKDKKQLLEISKENSLDKQEQINKIQLPIKIKIQIEEINMIIQQFILI